MNLTSRAQLVNSGVSQVASLFWKYLSLLPGSGQYFFFFPIANLASFKHGWPHLDYGVTLCSYMLSSILGPQLR